MQGPSLRDPRSPLAAILFRMAYIYRYVYFLHESTFGSRLVLFCCLRAILLSFLLFFAGAGKGWRLRRCCLPQSNNRG